MFDTFVDWPKMQIPYSQTLAIIMYYKTLEFVDPVPLLCMNRKI